jgi:hypothetical protein
MTPAYLASTLGIYDLASMRAMILWLLCLPPYLLAQPEPEIHLQHIWGRGGADSMFLTYTLHESLDHPADQRFVADRDLLRPLCVSRCSRDSVIIHDTLPSGEVMTLALFMQPFDSAGHQWRYFPGPDSLIRSIDSLPAYGAVDQLPSRQLDSLAIQFDGVPLIIPPHAYRCFFEVNLCDYGLFAQPISAFFSLDGQYLYLYLYGGQGAGTFFGKLIFDRSRYLSRIVSEYATLRRYHALRPDFVGY